MAPALRVNTDPDRYTLTALNRVPQTSGLYTGYFLCLELSLPTPPKPPQKIPS